MRHPVAQGETICQLNKPMDMNRYNTFYKIHKGLRALLAETTLQFQRTEPADEIAANEMTDRLEFVLKFFELHANAEDSFFNQPLEALDKDVAHLFEQEHQEDHRLSEELAKRIDDFKFATTRGEREMYWKELYYLFQEFTAFNLYHMNKEEKKLNASLWKHYSDEQIKKTEQALVQSFTPEKMAMSARVILKGATNKEVSDWLKEVSASAPVPVYQLLYNLAERELPEARWEMIRRQVTTPKGAVI
jgi:hypothetical protein